uniref:Gustatory receptor n=1 Tax=Strigamia maritima TaxID=126957 RepID=T1JNC9_STRMM
MICNFYSNPFNFFFIFINQSVSVQNSTALDVMANTGDQMSDLVDDLGLGFINRVWRVVFRAYGLHLDMLNPTCDSKCWKKNIYVAFIQFLYVITSLHFLLVIICYRIEKRQFGFTVVSIAITELIVLSTARILLKRQRKIRAIYRKIVFGLFTAKDLLTKFEQSTKLYLFIHLVITGMLNIIYISLEASGGFLQQISILGHAQIGIQNVYFTSATILLDYSIYLVFCIITDLIFVYYAHLCAGLALNFVLFNRCLEAELRATSLTPSKLNVLRHRFEHISSLVDEISQLFSPIIFFWISSFVFNICLDIGTFKEMALTSCILEFTAHTLLFVKEITYLLLILKASAQINTQAHIMQRRLYTKVIDDSRDRDASKFIFCTNYLLFSETVSSCNVGISVSGLFTLNVTSILSIAGTVLTYSIVLYQTS